MVPADTRIPLARLIRKHCWPSKRAHPRSRGERGLDRSFGAAHPTQASAQTALAA